MLKKIVACLLICGLLAVPGSVPGQSRTLQNNPDQNSDLKRLFLEQIAKSKSDNPAIELDVKRMEQERINSVAKSKWTSKQKTYLWLGIGAAVAATVIIVVVARRGNSDDNCFATCTAIGCPPPPCNR